MNALIDVSHLTFAFAGRTVLRDVSFQLFEGEQVAVVGPNGSGKSTLLKCLNGILDSRRGSISIGGRPLVDYSPKGLARWMAYVPQTQTKRPPFTVREYLRLARYPHESGWFKRGHRTDETVVRAMAETGVEPLAERPLNRLSGGEYQKVLIAAALVQETPILLLDEATAFLDFKHKSDLSRLLTTLNRRQGKTILSVTHDLNHAVLESHRIIALKSGEIAFDGEVSEFMTPRVVQRVFSSRFAFAAHPATGCPIVVPRAVLR